MRIRLTGLSTLWGGIQWEHKDDDKEIARRVISLLEDRRLLWVDYQYEIPDQCIASAKETRDALTAQIENPEIGEKLASLLKEIRGYLRDFMTYSPVGASGYRSISDSDAFAVALGRLRALVGERLAIIAATYDLEVEDELASIIPSSDAWFFEHFSEPPTESGPTGGL